MANPFATPDNEQSFSSLIDDAVLATGKPMQLVNAVQYANLTVRECQALALFAPDLVEDQLLVPANQSGPYTWTVPTATFRSLRTVKYANCCVWPELILPGRKQKGKIHYFYRADNYFVFAGAGASETIKKATYSWRKRLGYYGRLGINTTLFPGGSYSIRPAYYDGDAEKWQYLNTAQDAYIDTTGDPVVDEARQLKATNWLFSDWRDLILSGIKTKIWNAAGDPRAATEYSVYKQTQKILQNTVSYEGEGF